MECYICNHEMSLMDKKTGIWYCKSCGLYMEKGVVYRQPSEIDAESKLMDALEPLRRNNYQIIIKTLLQCCEEKVRVGAIRGLDIGCARGWFLEEAKKKGIDMDGIEPEDSFYMLAKRYGSNVIHGLFPKDFILEDSYDFIIFNDVLEHLPNLDEALRKCNELLRPGGILIINCPNSDGILFKSALQLMKLGVNTYWRRLWQMDFYSPHLWYFNKENLMQLMQKYGFTYQTECNLEVLSKNGMKERVMCNSKTYFTAEVTYGILRFMQPCLQYFPNDIMCMFYSKQGNCEI